jgi:2-dehydro-3-deoxyphosphogluconate aldolase/(4S)-4-hydroxy-2-oxoglutarate aldolase
MSTSTGALIERAGLIPVLRAKSTQQALAAADAMIAGGISVVEVTMTVPDAVDVLRELKQKYGTQLILGSGTVTHPKEAESTIEAGAEFVVSPSIHPDVVQATKSAHKLSIPGALTPTEVITAHRLGADYVKVFPCSAMGGAPYLKALLAPFPFLKLIPTGGVTLKTAEDFFKAGARALGVGSDLVNLAAVDDGQPEVITHAARKYLEIVANVRGS